MPIYRFNEVANKVEGIIILFLTNGFTSQIVTQILGFLVIKVESLYNVILERKGL